MWRITLSKSGERSTPNFPVCESRPRAPGGISNRWRINKTVDIATLSVQAQGNNAVPLNGDPLMIATSLVMSYARPVPISSVLALQST